MIDDQDCYTNNDVAARYAKVANEELGGVSTEDVLRDELLTIDTQYLPDQIPFDADPCDLFEPEAVFDQEAEAAYREWEESFLYFLERLQVPQACSLKNCPAVLVKTFWGG